MEIIYEIQTMTNKLHQADPDFVDKISPFFSILEKYFRYEVRGIQNIPRKKALIVMNHGIIPYHGFLLAKKIVDELRIYPRGLGAAFLFRIPGVREFFVKGGAVNANPRNAEALLNEGNVVMLAPGGIYEALIAKPGLKRIPWERRKGFVRIAIKTKSPIVPTYCNGINASYFNSYFLLKPRIKILESTRFSFPFFFGLGFFPLPVKLIHKIGKPIFLKKKKGESHVKYVDRFHREVLKAEAKLAQSDL